MSQKPGVRIEEGIVAAPCARGDSVHIYAIVRIVDRIVAIEPFEQASTIAVPCARGDLLPGIEARAEGQLQELKMWRYQEISLNYRSAVCARVIYQPPSTSTIEDEELACTAFNLGSWLPTPGFSYL